jgi:hypothetical protein
MEFKEELKMPQIRSKESLKEDSGNWPIIGIRNTGKSFVDPQKSSQFPLSFSNIYSLLLGPVLNRYKKRMFPYKLM